MMQKMIVADLEARLSYPEGDVSAPAALVIYDRDSNQTVAELQLTATDLLNMLASKRSGPLEGNAWLLNDRDRAVLGKVRTMINVWLPYVVDVFEVGDSRHINAWAADAVRTFGAHDYRISRSRTGYTVGLMFFHKAKAEADDQQLRAVQVKMDEFAREYAARADAHAAASRASR